MASMQAGVQLHLPTYKDLQIAELAELGKIAWSGGVTQLWVTDNLQSRNSFVVLAALAANIPINLGTAITVQYFRNPVDVADAVATISELMDATELSVGIGRGNSFTPNIVNTVKPITMLRETAQCLDHLLAGEKVNIGDYPTLASYFNFNPGASFQLNFKPTTPIRLYCAANGPLGLAVGGEFMDGLIFGGEFKAVSGTGRLPSLLRTFDGAARAAGKGDNLPKVAEIKLSVSKDRTSAREFAKHTAGRRTLNLRRRGYTPEDIQQLGVTTEDVDLLDVAEKGGASAAQFDNLVTDQVIDAIHVAGDPAYCRDRMVEVAKVAEEHGFQQLMFSELGPDVHESLHLLCDEILPAI